MNQREQQTARVNIDDATWQAFRIRAIQANRSVADELARLLRNDLRRARPSDAPRPPTSEPSAQEAEETPDPAPTERATTKAQRVRPTLRLADLDLLTELPYRDQPPPSP